LEFADYREYQPGDDFRYLDRHVYARHGRTVLRQFHIDQQASITVLLDMSASMAAGEPAKERLAKQCAAALTAIALFGGDRVDIGLFDGQGVQWHPRLAKVASLPRLFGWLEGAKARGEVSLEGVARVTYERLSPGGLLVVVSDWLLDGVPAALARWFQRGQELVALQVLSPDELDPRRLGSGALQLVDAERGEVVDVDLSPDTETRYREAFEAHQRELRDSMAAVQAWHVSASSDESVDDVLLSRMRVQGVLR
jgi:uncharacterized protein (DUF58 family)